ncbi:MAG: glycosyltransferase [Deltaproteobacteria bacterium]|nr:glycosyltransferase [Deltaproteobacteria bacterium]
MASHLFSIIIPTYDRPRQLGSCLEAISCIDYPGDRFEVIVVDDGSEMPLDAIVASFREKLDVVLLTQPHSGPAAGRNTGAARAKGQFLAFTDDDCAPAADWLKALSTCFGRVSEQAVGGKTVNAIVGNLYSTTTQMIVDYLIHGHNPNSERGRFFTSNNFAIPADSFHAMGGFDTTFSLSAGEDRELCDRLSGYGYPLAYAPEVMVYHFHKLTLTTFLRRHFTYGRGSFQFHRTRSRRNNQPLMPESNLLLFYMNLLLYPFSNGLSFRTIVVEMLLVLSQVGNAAGHLWERVNCCSERISRPDFIETAESFNRTVEKDL